MNLNNKRVVLISGGTNGIGKATALELSSLGLNVCIIGQSTQKCISTSEYIKNLSGNEVGWICSDLSTIQGINQAANTFLDRYDQLHILINNAGAFFKKRIITEDGIEKTFALNHINYFLLTNLLLDTLKVSAPARIINVSSITHLGIRQINFDTLQGKKLYNGWQAYGLSKLCNILFTRELSRRVQPETITVNAMNPGYVSTGFMKNNRGFLKTLVSLGGILLGKTPKKGAETIVYLAVSKDVGLTTGKFFYNCTESNTSKLSQDQEVAVKLWKLSKLLTNT